MYLFYTETEADKGRVDAIYQDHEVPEELKAKGYKHDGVLPDPLAGSEENAVLYLNPKTGALWYEGKVSGEMNEVAELRQRLHEAEARLMNPGEHYKALDKVRASLAEVKEAKRAQLVYMSEEDTANGFVSESLGYHFGFEPKDQDNMTKQTILFIANPQAESCTWRTKDAGIVTLTKEQFMGVVQEGERHTRMNINRLWTLEQDVDAAQTKEDVDKIVW